MTEIGQKHPRVRDEKYLAYVRMQPCCVCKSPGPCDAAHIRTASTVYNKRATGMQEKPDDRWCVPLCRPIPGVKRGCHKNQHSVGEMQFWRDLGINPFEIAIKLYAEGGHPNDPQPKRKKRKTIVPKGHGAKIPSRPFPKSQRKFGQ
jgi:hypothetical protein